MDVKDVSDCQFSSWYNRFKEVTFKSEILGLSDEVIQYLLADGLVLPKGCDPQLTSTELEEDSDEEQTEWETHPDDEAKRPDFPELNQAIEAAIKKLGGKVFPKLNWSSPKDASWISFGGSLHCTCPGDVYLLLKSSSFCAHDLVEPYMQCSDYQEGERYSVKYELVLRKWYDIQPSCEFRAFVKNGQLIAISQRHHSSHYGFLLSQREDIVSDITQFFTQYIQGKYANRSVVFDVYRKQQGIVYLVDLNPFGPVTDALCFTWEELNAIENTHTPVVRLVDTAGVQPHPLSQYGVPLDIVHLTTGTDASKLIDLMKMNTQSSNNSSDEDQTTETSKR